MAEDVVSITGATAGTITFDGTTYGIDTRREWRPNVASRRRGTLGGRGSYSDVVETIPIFIRSNTKAEVKTKLNELIAAIDQASRWWRGEPVTAVLLNWDADGAGSPITSTILGQAGNNAQWLVLSPKYREHLDQFVIGPINLSFVRHGLWLGTTETKASSASTGNPAILTAATFTDDAPISWPYNVEVFFDLGGSAAPLQDIYVFVQSAANKLWLAEAEARDGDSATGISDEVVATASAGNLTRIDCDSDSNVKWLYFDTTFPNTVNRIALYAMVRNRSAATVDWTLTGWVNAAGVSTFSYTRNTVIEAGDNVRQLVYLGVVGVEPSTNPRVYVVANPSTTGAGGDVDDLDVDFVCGIAIDEDSHVVKMWDVNVETTDGDTNVQIDHRLDEKPSPLVSMDLDSDSSVWHYPVYQGDALLMSKGTVVAAMVVGNDTAGTDWVLEDGGASEIDLTLSVTRNKAFLVPQ